MDMKSDGNTTVLERRSDTEMVATRVVDGPVRLVYDAWTKPELMKRWWAPKSFGITIVSCEMDVRIGGTYRFLMAHPSMPQPMAFFGKYLEVVPQSRVVWTNEESGDAGQVTTVTFQPKGDATLVVIHDLYPSKEALDEAIASGSTGGCAEQFTQLDALLTQPDMPM